MFGLFGKRKKKEDKDERVLISSKVIVDQSIQKMTAQADHDFTKPNYNPKTRKTFYDDGLSHKVAKDKVFSGKDIVRDKYTGAELVSTVKEAKIRFGDQWQEHLAEADHIDPLNQLYKRAGNNPWISTEDLKEIGNSQDNFQVISRRTNQTGGKGGSTQLEWSQDYEKMKKISEQTGETINQVSEKIRKTGELAEKRNDKKIAQSSIKNISSTAHNAGKDAAINSGGTAATISGIYNVVSVINGEKTVSQALTDVGKDSSKAAGSGYINGAGLTVFNHTLTNSDSKFLTALGEKNVAGKIITTVSITGETVVNWASGEISTEECLVELGEKGFNYCGSVYGGIAGKAIIGLAVTGPVSLPVAIVGGAVGSLAGSMLTSGLYNSVMQEIQDLKEEERRRQQEIYEAMMRYYAEQQRRKEVKELITINTERAVNNSIQSIIQSGKFQNLINEAAGYLSNRIEAEQKIAECVLVTLQLEEYRAQLQYYANNYFSEYEGCFKSALDLLDSSLSVGDYDGAIDATNQVTLLFGKKPLTENSEDFKKIMFGNEDIIL